MKLDQTLDALVGREGGYANDPTDRGGETMWGVTIAVARAYGYHGPMRDMPQATARAIYRERYWIQPKFDQVDALSPMLAEEMLDTGVNMHPSWAGKFLQRGLNHLNNMGTLYPDLTVDGAVGKMTLYALRSYLSGRGKVGERTLFNLLNAQQGVRYMDITEDNPSQEKYAYGWQSNRVGMA